MRLNVALFFAVASYSTLQSIIIPILPSIADRFDAPTSQAAWVVSGFLMIGAVVTPIAGRLGDLLGHVKVLLVILCIFVVGALMAVLATSMLMLIAARMLQGVGAAAVSLSFSIIKGRYPPAQAAGAVGMISATMAVAAGTGLSLSGVISTYLGYGMIFGLPLLVSTCSIILLLPQVRSDRPVATNRRSVNWFGGLFFAVAMLFVLLAITQGNNWGWLAPATALLFLGGVGVGAVWVFFELRALNPLLDVRLLVSPSLIRINTTTLLAGMVMFSMYTLLPVFLQARTPDGLGLGLSVSTSGLLMLPIAIMNFTSGALAGRIAAAIGSRNMLVLGCVMNFLAIALLAILHDSPATIIAVCILHGIGVGLSFASMPALTMLAVSPQQAGVAAGIYNTLRTVGGAIGTQVGYAILAAGGRSPTGQTFTALVVFVGVVCAAAIVSALTIPRSPSQYAV
ncbi:hypothetical protein GCM10025768_04080 [Microbacterium pseudoresistens]|uniref:Putative MFS family arabinose efflux permease n=1 Tax=Microbacterium pseudoresistens TaxID=640634 RepID=A0A7Y9EUW0_9MICO|nr:MFS transporter [Microbacterium pseudoresistens]NYD54244.1 putative MFS family arabinose efflux permease [Microbacterium pseudoresistens]